MPIYCVPSAIFPALAYAGSVIKSGVPSRWKKIQAYLEQFCSKNPAVLNSTPIKIGHSGHVIQSAKVPDATVLRSVATMLLSSPSKEGLTLGDFKEGIWDEEDIGLFPIVFIPVETTCKNGTCSGDLKTYHTPAFVRIYSSRGMLKASSYHKKCERCQYKYYFSYTQSKEGVKTFTHEALNSEFLLISSRTAFEWVYLRSTADIIENTGSSFTAISDSYESTFLEPLDEMRLEEGYFISRLLKLYSESCRPLQILHQVESKRMDLEECCGEALELYSKELMGFDEHQCDIPGCKEGLIVVDGIEKIHRRTCAAPRTTLKAHPSMPRFITSCPESPAGSSEYCKDHKILESKATKRPHIVVTIDSINMRSSTRVVNFTDGLPTSDDVSVHVGCKDGKKVDRFRTRSAGISAIVRPCGIIVDVRELLTCESPSQVMAQLLTLRCDRKVKFSYVGYDRACELKPFLNNLARKGNMGAVILLDDTDYIVDRFHIKGHVNPKCDIKSGDCEFHPDLPKFSDIASGNTECAEQCFSFLRRFGHMMKYMGKNKYLFFLQIIVLARNKVTERRRTKQAS